MPLAAPRAARKVIELERGETADGVAITEDGRIWMAPQRWIGELYAIDGRFE